MGAKGKRLEPKLEQAQEDGELVRVHRRRNLEPHEGYIRAVGERWLLLATLDDAILLDGYTALRSRDVTKVRRKRNAAFVRAALTLRGQWPPAPPPVDLEDTRALLASLQGRWPLVTVHIELDDPDSCYIGEVQQLSRKTMFLREITPQATWTGPRGKFRINRITRVDVGASYEQALIEVANSTQPSPLK